MDKGILIGKLGVLQSSGRVQAGLMNTPKELSVEEWKEIMNVQAIRESRGLSGTETSIQFSQMAYGVRFDFVAITGPGYVGDLYILSGDALGEPFTLIRKDDELVVV